MQASEFDINEGHDLMFPDQSQLLFSADGYRRGVFKRTIFNMCYSCAGDDSGTGRRLREERQYDKPYLRSECAKYTAQ